MRYADFLRGWARILAGYQPVLSVEITKECPLSCPGCYAYHPDHLEGFGLRSLSDHKGNDLVAGILDLIERYRPLAIYLVGGEPLVRFRELNVLLPAICARNVNVEVVTSAVRPIPREWADLDRLKIIVSVDGLPPEHDERRKPATYRRILQHIQGHRIGVHCTITRQMMHRPGYLKDFVEFWSQRPEVQLIRMSLFTAQVVETSFEILSREMREQAVSELRQLHGEFSKLQVGPRMLDAMLSPPRDPQHCLFARVTRCISADLKTPVTPCQLGGNPKCSECGCLASAGLHAVGQHRLPGGIKVASLFEVSDRTGALVRRLRASVSGRSSL